MRTATSASWTCGASASASLAEDALAPVRTNDLPEIEYSSEGALMPNLVGMRARDAIGLLREEGLEVVVYGSGRVAGHQPSAHAALVPGQRVLLQLAELSEQP